MEYSNSWPPGWQLVVPATAVLASVLWWLPTVNRRLVIFLPVAASLLMGPVMTNLYTINTPQGGTNPLSGPPSAVEGSLSMRFVAAHEGEDLRSLHLAFGAPPSPELVQLLGDTDGPTVTWAAMTVTAQNAALYQLESRRPVAALGGWLGFDPAPTVDGFKDLVAEGRIGLFIDQPELLKEQAIGRETGKIVEWIRAHFVAEKLGPHVVYDLQSRPTA